MLFRPLFTVFHVLLFSRHTPCATIKGRIIQNLDSDISFEVMTDTANPPSIRDAAPVRAPLPRSNYHNEHDEIPVFHETTVDWREDQTLRLESEREAGFLPSWYGDEE